MLTLKRLAWLKAGAPPRNVTEAALSAKLGGGGASYEKTVGPSAIVSITDAKKKPALSLLASMEPIQDLHGYESPWPAGGGKNLFNDTFDGWTKPVNYWIYPVSLPEGTYKLSAALRTGKTAVTGTVVGFAKSGTQYSEFNPLYTLINTSGSVLTVSAISVSSSDSPVLAFYGSEESFNAVMDAYEIQLEAGSTATAYAPYSNICPITGHTGQTAYRAGKNLMPYPYDISKPDAFPGGWNGISTDGEWVVQTGYGIVAGGFGGVSVYDLKAGTYTVSFDADPTLCVNENYSISVWRLYTDGTRDSENVYTQTATHYSKKIVFAKDVKCLSIRATSGGNSNTSVLRYKNIQLELASTASEFEAYRGTTYPVTWQDEAGTVYGGTVDVVTGVLTVTHGVVTFDGTQTNFGISTGVTANRIRWDGYPSVGVPKESFLSDTLKTSTNSTGIKGDPWLIYNTTYDARMYISVPTTIASVDDFVAYCTSNPITVVYTLATPQTYQLDPQTVNLLKGSNNLWNDAGDSTVTYVGTEPGE